MYCGENLEDLHHLPTTTRNWIVNDLFGSLLLQRGKRHDSRHLHQLLRRLRLQEHHARSTPARTTDDDEILGTSMTCSGTGLPRCIEVLERSHQLLHHLRHRNVQNLYHGHDVSELLHGALLDPSLWLLRLTQAGWPGTPGLFLVRKKVVPQLGRDVQLVPPPRSWPASVPVGLCGGRSRPGASRRCGKNWCNPRCRRAAAVAYATLGRGPHVIHMKSRIESNEKKKVTHGPKLVVVVEWLIILKE